ncbi:hypothetical protein [Reyranella massiliensis]|nr:hypothetical protein [Reyranella massiliensis]
MINGHLVEKEAVEFGLLKTVPELLIGDRPIDVVQRSLPGS